MQPSDDIKAKLDISDVLGEYIKLVPSGLNHKAVCPFHREKNPSLMISHDKQIWRCFGCAKGGDIFSFIMEIEGISFVEALRLLATKAGITLTRTNPQAESAKNRTLDILDLSSKYYHKVLFGSTIAKNALDYLRKRGLDQNMIEDWQIGYSPESWDDLYKLLKKKGYADDDILASGMIIKKDKGFGFYNRFRGRIMFPIKDINGSVVAFTARVSPEKEATEKMGKYINSPSTSIYDKSSIIFGLDQAKLHIKRADLIIVVEGQMDVITAHTRGFKNIIASSGTALTERQIKTLKRYSNNIALAFDADDAGLLAAERAIDESLRQDMSVSVVNIPNGKDPDDCISNDPNSWIVATEKRTHAMEHYFNHYLKDLDLSKIGDKRIAVKKILPKVKIISDNIEKDFWLKKLSNTIDVKEELLREALEVIEQGTKTKPADAAHQDSEPAKRFSREDMLSDSAIGLIIKFPFLIESALNKLPSEWINEKLTQDLYINILIYYNGNSNLILNSSNFYSKFRSHIESTQSQDQVNMLDYLAMEAEKTYNNFDDISAKDEVLSIMISLKKRFLEGSMKSIERQLIAAEQSRDQEKIKDLMIKFTKLSEELKS